MNSPHQLLSAARTGVSAAVHSRLVTVALWLPLPRLSCTSLNIRSVRTEVIGQVGS